MDDDYPDHHYTAMLEFRKVTRNATPQIKLRQRQLQSTGYKKLLQHMITRVNRKELLNNVFLVRLPIDATAKIKTDHPIKRVPRAGCAKKMISSAFREAWSKWTKEVSESDGRPTIYVWAYPPDMSFVFTTSIPFEENGQYESDELPKTQFIPYPEFA